jgi:hypothetical protein
MSVGRSDCPRCGGTGSIPAPPRPPHPPTFHRCVCVLQSDILANVDRGMKGLAHAAIVPESPLLGLIDRDVILQGAGDVVRAHLRHVAVRQPPVWMFKVVSDADLVTAWLSSTVIKGIEIFDADAFAVSTQYLSIPDLVVPPDLLIIRMGVKVARNSAAPEVLAEALRTRQHQDRPTWFWDDHLHPIGHGHLFWSDAVGEALAGFARVNLTAEGNKVSRKPSPGTAMGNNANHPAPPRKGVSMRRGLGTGGSRKTLRGSKK